MKTISNNHPFHKWVPRPVGIIILLLMFFPPTFSGGAYLSNLSEMSGSLGINPENIQLASFFTNIGMCLFPPLMITFLQTRRIKQTYMWCFSLLLVLNWICAETRSIPVLLASCLLIGFVRGIVMIHCTFTIAPYLTGTNTLDMFTSTRELSPAEQYAQERKRTFLMPVLYFFILAIAQLSNATTAWFAYHYCWQDAYYAVMGMLLLAILLVTIFMPTEPSRSIKIQWRLLPDMLTLAIMLCCLVYILVFGNTLDWFDAPSIRLATIAAVLTLGLFLFFSLNHKTTAYLPLEVFKHRNVLIAIALFFLFMIFNSTTAFISLNAKLSTPINNMQSSCLSYWAIVGCFLGFVISLVLVLIKVRFRTAFIGGILIMTCSNIYMYFNFQSIGSYEDMAMPMILNFTGLLILYSLVPAFSMKNISSRFLVTTVFIMILIRNSIAPVVGSTIYSNWLEERQQHYITRLSENVDQNNLPANKLYQSSILVGNNQGKSLHESEQLATTSIYGKIAVQATFLAMKDISGTTIWLMLGSAGLILLLPYHKKETT